MKEKEFDNLIKTKVDNLDNLIGIEFEEDVVWKNVSTKKPKSIKNRLYFFISASVLILTGIIYFSFFAPNKPLEEKKIQIPVKIKEVEIIDKIVSKEMGVIKNTKGITSKKNNLKKKLTTEKNQIIITNDTDSIIDKLNLKLINTNKINELPKISTQNKLHKLNLETVTETKAYIHVYRPSKIIVGALNYFTLKANGKKIGTISNGEYEVFMVESGFTEFEIKRKKIKINLKAKKSYYLRTELMFLGKTKFEWVTESCAKKELDIKK